MKKTITVVLFILISISSYSQEKYNYKVTVSIFKSMVETIDSAFKLKLKTKTRDEFQMIRIIDKTKSFYATTSGGYWNNTIPLIIINQYPYDINSQKYLDIIAVESIQKEDTITVTIISLLNHSCNELAITITQTFKVMKDKGILLKTNQIMVLDDWNPYPNE